MAPGSDPFEAHLTRAEQLYQGGDVVQAGQIWQAILKRVPGHPTARAGLYKVKLYFDARATQDGLAEAQELALKLAPVQASPEEIERRLQRGCELYDAGDLQEALSIWEAILQQHPDHALARGYAEGARRALEPKALDPKDTADELPVSLAQPAPEALEPVPAPLHLAETPTGAAEPPSAPVDDEALERLLREGCTLYDMGQLEEAKAKWEAILQQQPGHALAHNYLDGVLRDLGLPPLAPLSTAQETAAPEGVPTPAKDLEQLLREGSQLFDLGMTEEAVAKWEEAQALAPEDSRIDSYLAMARKELQPRSALRPPPPPPAAAPVLAAAPPPPAAPFRLPEPASAPEPNQALATLEVTEPVLPPATLTEAAPAPRKGLDMPVSVGRFALPDFLRSPRNLGILLAGGVVLSIALGLIQGKRREINLKAAVASARASAMAPVARSVQIPDLGFTAEGLKQEFDACLGEDPFRAYCLAQELTQRNPADPEAARLLDRARSAMSSLGGVPATSKELDRLAQAGDLDGAEQLLRQALRLDPDNRELRTRYARVNQHLAQIYAAKEKWDEAADALKRGRAMFPQDKAWRARLFLLENLKGQPKAERESWIHLLG